MREASKLRLFHKLVMTSLTAVMIMGTAVPLHAAESDVAAIKPVHGDGYVLVNPASSTTKHLPDGKTFMPTGEISPETVVVVTDPDGSLPGEMTQAQLTTMVADQRAARASGVVSDGKVLEVSAQPHDGAKSVDGGVSALVSRAYSVSYPWLTFTGGSVIGVNDSTRLNYWHNVTSGTVQWVQGEGLGYYRGYNGSTFGLWSAYYSMGTAKSNASGGASIPWGNVAANTSFRAKSLNSAVAGGYWGY